MLIDTHCHLDAPDFLETTDQLLLQAQQKGIDYVVIPAVAAFNFESVRQLAHRSSALTYALGIHPLFVPQATEQDLLLLAKTLEQNIDDPQLVAVGEIGLDFFVPELCTPEMRDKQAYFYEAQLALAQRFELPVLLHVRRSQDVILKYLRRHPKVTGIAHAFNGSFQQAQQFIKKGFKLGFGGAMTFSRAKQIRRLATELDLTHLVLETDAPDMAPAWLDPKRQAHEYNRPAELAQIAEHLAALRAVAIESIHEQTTINAFCALPRLAQWHQAQ